MLTDAYQDLHNHQSIFEDIKSNITQSRSNIPATGAAVPGNSSCFSMGPGLDLYINGSMDERSLESIEEDVRELGSQ